ncbi:MAG: serine--tRNA ligase [Candidatus Hydrogenedentota bacterium]
MLDPKLLKEKYNEIKQNLRNRNLNLDLDAVISFYNKRLELIKRIEELRCERNTIADKLKQKVAIDEKNTLVERGKNIKNELSIIEKEYEDIDKKFWELFKKIPNFTHPHIPVGKDEHSNREIKRWGDIPVFNFKPLDHISLGQKLDLIDFDTASRVSQQKFYYLKKEAVLLEFALCVFALKKLQKKGFTLIITPDVARSEIVEGAGFNPRGPETNIYSIANFDLCLVGTAEITLAGMLSDCILYEKELPLLYCGFSHCFRTEAGAYGQYSKGLFRVHQFSKVEMFAFTKQEDSDTIHEKFLQIEEEIYQDLKIPYRIVEVCSGELGAPAYRKFDIESWMPGRGEKGDFGEITSTSNCTDYQSRRLNIKYKTLNGDKKFVHMINGTAVAISRTLIAIMENYQTEEGFIIVPEVLRDIVGKNIIKS